MYIAKGITPCQTNTPSMWFGERTDTKAAKTAIALCRLCPERIDCLRSTLRWEEREDQVQPCILGGKTEGQRRELLLKRKLRRQQQAETA